MKVLGISIPFIGKEKTRLKNALDSQIAENIPNTSQVSNNNNPDTTDEEKKHRPSYKLMVNRYYPFDADQENLRLAIWNAENPVLPNRSLLYALYKEALRDFHLRSQLKTAENEVISEPWAIIDSKTKEINKKLTELLQTKWFEMCLRYYMQAEWWGFSLIELGIMEKDPEQGWIFKNVNLIPREHVRPETGEILIFQNDPKGIAFREPPFDTWLIEAGDHHDLGLLEIATKYAIYKKYGIADWARSAEKWGDPTLVIRSASDNDAENAKKEEFAANFGNNGWGLFDKEDEIQLLERANGTGYAIFKDFLAFINDENSKGVNGQTATADNQAWAGTADVQEKILNGYTETRLRGLMYWVNDILLPKIIGVNNGDSAYSKLKGYSFMPLCFMKELKTPDQIALEKQQAMQGQNQGNNQDNQQAPPQRKKFQP